MRSCSGGDGGAVIEDEDEDEDEVSFSSKVHFVSLCFTIILVWSIIFFGQSLMPTKQVTSHINCQCGIR